MPDPPDPLSIKIHVPSTSIASANVEVRCVVSQEPVSRGPYPKLTAKQRAVIGKRVAEHGVAVTIRFYVKEFPNLKESSVHTWKSTYTSKIKERRREGHEMFP